MDAHGPGAASKLTRTPSSLLRSLTVRNCSSFHAVLLHDDPEPDHKKSHAVAAQHTHNLRSRRCGSLLFRRLPQHELHAFRYGQRHWSKAFSAFDSVHLQ
jgi:hypothetical protein